MQTQMNTTTELTTATIKSQVINDLLQKAGSITDSQQLTDVILQWKATNSVTGFPTEIQEAILNVLNHLFLSLLDAEIANVRPYHDEQDYRKQVSRLWKRKTRRPRLPLDEFFSETQLKGLLDAATFENYQAYQVLYQIDKGLKAQRPFSPTNDYKQQLRRQDRYQGLSKQIIADENLQYLFYEVDSFLLEFPSDDVETSSAFNGNITEIW